MCIKQWINISVFWIYIQSLQFFSCCIRPGCQILSFRIARKEILYDWCNRLICHTSVLCMIFVIGQHYLIGQRFIRTFKNNLSIIISRMSLFRMNDITEIKQISHKIVRCKVIPSNLDKITAHMHLHRHKSPSILCKMNNLTGCFF